MNWGIYAKLIKIDKGRLSIPEAEKRLPLEYVRSLMEAFRANLQVRIFIIETMSQQAFVYLSEKSISIDGLSERNFNY